MGSWHLPGGRIGLQNVAIARSALKRDPPCISNPDTNHLYNRAARTRYDLSLRCCEAFVDEARDHLAIEPMHERKLVLRHAVQNAVEQRQCLALLLAKAWFSWTHRHACELTESLAADIA
jgi:hypothetical protein